MKNIIAYVHTHWDREWYREFEEFRLRLIEVFNEVICALETEELPCFYFDGQTSALEDYLEIFPDKTMLIKKLVKEKKLRIGPFYCSADNFLVSGESLYRNLEIGINKSKEFGESEFIAYLSDTFGHSHCIPYILKSFGIDKACLWRGLGNLQADLNWCSINVTYLIQGYYQDFLNTNLSIEKKAELLKNYIDKISLKSSDNIILPIGADHLAIPKNINSQIKTLNKFYKDYNIKISTPFEYFEKIKKRKNVQGEFLDNSHNFILPGVYSARMRLKQRNIQAQWLLSRIAEPIQALGNFFFNAMDKQNEIDYSYKTLIKNHAHDSIYGCSIDKVYEETLIRYEKVNSVANGVIKRTLRDLSDKGGSLSVVNLSNFEYNGHIKIITDKKLPKWLKAVKISSTKGFTDEKLYNIYDVPITEDYTDISEYIINVKGLAPLSFTKLNKNNICSQNYLKNTQSSIENENLKIEIKSGILVLTDKKSGIKYSNFINFTDKADIGDSYNFGPLKNDKPIKAKLIKSKISKKNSIRSILSLVYEINIPKTSLNTGRTRITLKHRININIILYNNSEYAEFNIDWVNKSKNHILQVEFRLNEPITASVSEDLYGTVRRTYDPDYNINDFIPAKKGIELKTNIYPMQRFIKVQNLGLITKGNCEYEIEKNILKLTILRATGVISNPKNPSRGTPAGPPLETPKMQEIGENYSSFAIAFPKNENDMFRLTEQFFEPCYTLLSNKNSLEFFKIDNSNILVYAIKKQSDGLLFRLFNNSEKVQTAKLNLLKNYKIFEYDIKLNILKEIDSTIVMREKEIKNIIIKN